MLKKIGILALALLITGSIDSVRNMPTTALFGPQLLFFAMMGAIFFMIPVALVSAELVTTPDLHGGIYSWVKKSLGPRIGFVAIWLQWINTMVWYPTILSFVAGTTAYLIDPALAGNTFYLISVILSVFWLLTLINLRGIHVSTWVASICSVIGMIIPLGLIMVLGLIWLIKGLPLQIHVNTQTVFPVLTRTDSWMSLTAIITSFLGMELATVHARDIENPARIFPRALCFAVFFILVTTILGSLVIAWVLPNRDIQLVSGAIQVFDHFFSEYHLPWLLPVLVVMLVVGSVGGMVNWVISPAKGLLHAAQDHFLPPFFCKVNRFGAAGRLLITQACLVSLMCVAFLLMPSVNGSYWLLTDLSTELYVLMYMLLFVAAFFLKRKRVTQQAGFTIWGGMTGMAIVCLMGLLGCVIAFSIGFFAPAGIDVGTARHYSSIFSMGLIIMVAPVVLFIIYQSRLTHLKNAQQDILESRIP